MDFLQLAQTSLFEGVPPRDIQHILEGVKTREERFLAGETIVREGDVLRYLGIILDGNAVAVKNGMGGEEVVVSRLTKNSIFADILSGSINFESPVSVIACSWCNLFFINYSQLLYSDHPSTHIVLQNMIKTISLKYFTQSKRIELLMLKSVRQKIVTFLQMEQETVGASCFEIPFDRRLFADYLGVERSALSRELSRMKKEGLIDFKKNSFSLLF